MSTESLFSPSSPCWWISSTACIASRNRFEAAGDRLRASRIFDGYGEDVEQGAQNSDSLPTPFAHYPGALGTTPEAAACLRANDYALDHLDYDWRLNNAGRAGS
ncbi:hypothetical protein [Denitromonas iodatirespirans]|uniref:Uncharacterized protein n=1 Tax=Denitromonas iodatirespirans TaxID=2795389 RepID=A0A944HA69_DENI1|nr:hypothetical protein [Denitromonas iodatirespirans]MBT0960277.1 hypothetical protein [Denitromonas iodatirespirans]